MALAPVIPIAPSPDLTADLRTGAVPASVVGLGAHLPGEVVTNRDLSHVLDTSDEWIRSRTGIAQRHRAAPGQATSDLAAAAGAAALADASLAPTDVDLVLVATTTPDHSIGGTAPRTAALLGVEAPALDLNAACSGFVYGLRAAAGWLATGARRVLLVGAETFSRAVDPEDRTTGVLFGDGAGAVVLGAGGPGDLGPFDLGSDGSGTELLYVPAGGSRLPANVETVQDRQHYLHMNGPEIYRQAVTRMVASSRAVLDAAGLGPDGVDLLVGHQANLRILDAVSQRVGIPGERSHVSVDRHGNTSAASIPLALADARASGRLHAGDRILLTSFGAGLTWASCLLTWSDQGGTR